MVKPSGNTPNNRPMKHLLTLTALLISSLAMGQFPNLPYNPDENGDGLIGVVDLQGLLANYGNEFASAVVSEDGENAITYMGDMAYPLCAQACRNLPGMWEMPELEDLGLVWNEVDNPTALVRTWLKRNLTDFQTQAFYSGADFNNDNHYVEQYPYPAQNFRCYCAAKQLPRVEIAQCELPSTAYDTSSDGESCMSNKTAAGWYPLGGPTKIVQPSNGLFKSVQAFWRWAE